MVATIAPIIPKWAQSLGVMDRSRALVRSQCRACGIQQRVDVEAMAMKLGRHATLIDHAERCSIVACHGTVFYMTARSYGRQWITLVTCDELRLAGMDHVATPRNVQSLGLIEPGTKESMG